MNLPLGTRDEIFIWQKMAECNLHSFSQVIKKQKNTYTTK